jgi:hypothetical protein
MSISAVSSQSGQYTQSDTTSLEASKQKIETEIKTLQKEDAAKNKKEIQSLQQQVQQIELQIAQQKQTSQTSTPSTPTTENVGPAYSVQLNNQNVQTTAKSLKESSSISPDTSQTIDLSI